MFKTLITFVLIIFFISFIYSIYLIFKPKINKISSNSYSNIDELIKELKIAIALAEVRAKNGQKEAEAAELQAKKTRIDADAEAYKNRQLVSSGLTPWDKADFEMKTKIGVAEALSKVQLPAYYAPGNSGTNNNILDALLSTKLLDGK